MFYFFKSLVKSLSQINFFFSKFEWFFNIHFSSK